MKFLAGRLVNALSRDVVALFLALGDRRIGMPAKVVALATIFYVLSPIDLLPDFIPFAGIVDDILLVPFSFYILEKMITPAILAEYAVRAATFRKWLIVGGIIFIAFWFAVFAFFAWVVFYH